MKDKIIFNFPSIGRSSTMSKNSQFMPFPVSTWSNPVTRNLTKKSVAWHLDNSDKFGEVF